MVGWHHRLNGHGFGPGKAGISGLHSRLPPGSQASSRGEAKDSALLSSRDAGLLEPPESLTQPPAHPYSEDGDFRGPNQGRVLPVMSPYPGSPLRGS